MGLSGYLFLYKAVIDSLTSGPIEINIVAKSPNEALEMAQTYVKEHRPYYSLTSISVNGKSILIKDGQSGE